jgi:hypothetical protein
MEDISRVEEEFLKKDLYESLKWLFVGAVTWCARPLEKDSHQLRGLGMFACFVQARALYEFFNSTERGTLESGSTASSADFDFPRQKPCDPEQLYSKYMAKNTPAQKRVFHLVYDRAGWAGGSATDESDHLKNRVLDFAKDLKRLTKEFASSVTEEKYRELVECALARALQDGHELAVKYGISDPL